MRPRGDTDLLIPMPARARVDALLRSLGYERGGGVSGELVSYQAAWSRECQLGVSHDLDVHWRINNSQILSKLFSYEELEVSATPVTELGPHAYGLSPPHAALFACMHRAGHRNAPYYVDGVAHHGGDRLIWLYDIHLLFSQMHEAHIAEFVALATVKRLKSICRNALELCIERFATPIASWVIGELSSASGAEPSAMYLTAGPMRQMLGDFIAIQSGADRIRWIREIAFPSRAYMRQKYAATAVTWLPLLYARRAAGGLWRVASRSGP